MKCPVCEKVDLIKEVKQGVEIDYCPECRGIWLDRGELEKIVKNGDDIQSEQSEDFWMTVDDTTKQFSFASFLNDFLKI